MTEYVPCLGGCERMVPIGQKCVECATAAVAAWLVIKREKEMATHGDDTSMATQGRAEPEGWAERSWPSFGKGRGAQPQAARKVRRQPKARIVLGSDGGDAGAGTQAEWRFDTPAAFAPGVGCIE